MSKLIVILLVLFRFLGLVLTTDGSKIQQEERPILSSYGSYRILGALIIGNIIHRALPLMNKNKPILLMIDYLTWGVPALMTLSGFDMDNLKYHILNTMTGYSGPDNINFNSFIII